LTEPIPLDTKDEDGCTPLWVAACNGNTEVVEILAQEKRVNVNSLSDNGRSPIFWPAAHGDKEAVDILIRAGAKSHYVDKDGDTALLLARQNGHEHIVKVLHDAQSAEQRESASAVLWWRHLSMIAALTLLGFISVGAFMSF
jgi:ankyrin repeat protein